MLSIGSSSGMISQLGIYRMDIFVVLERPGYRDGRRRCCHRSRHCKYRVGIQHRVECLLVHKAEQCMQIHLNFHWLYWAIN